MLSSILFSIALLIASGQSLGTDQAYTFRRVDAYPGDVDSDEILQLHRRPLLHHHHSRKRSGRRDGRNEAPDLGTIEDLEHGELEQRGAPDGNGEDEDGVLYMQSDSWEESVLNLHNEHRARFQSPNLSWSYKLYEDAQEYARQCKPYHSGTEQGENLAANTRKGYSFKNAMDDWMAEYSHYQYDNPPPQGSPGTGHFTQVVWKATTEVGCAKARCKNMFKSGKVATSFVCRYWPPGNFRGEYGRNVDRPAY
ncbi:hypothetical protein PM082_020300 [Marasmius tenuissimus]|nr:hypothetical protein PM082_020300 [Marasmius tenuissimus]